MEPRISGFLVGQKTRLDCGLEDWVPQPGISSVLGAFREALIAVDRHSRSETQEFLPQKRSRLYGIAATLAQCPQGNRGSAQDRSVSLVQSNVIRAELGPTPPPSGQLS